MSADGKIIVSKKAWAFRWVTLSAIFIITAFNIYSGLLIRNQLVVFSTLVLLDTLLAFIVGWLYYKNPSKGKTGTEAGIYHNTCL